MAALFGQGDVLFGQDPLDGSGLLIAAVHLALQSSVDGLDRVQASNCKPEWPQASDFYGRLNLGLLGLYLATQLTTCDVDPAYAL